jgi:hypothetical protein
MVFQARACLISRLFFQADLDEGDYDDLVVPDSGDPHLSVNTIIEYQAVFRDVIGDFMMSVAGGYMVGGPGTTIEIDESMFGHNHHCLIRHSKCPKLYTT